MSSDDTPIAQLTLRQKGHFASLLAELEDAASDHNSEHVVYVLKHIFTGDHPTTLTRFAAEALVEGGFANLARRLADEDPETYAMLQEGIAIYRGGTPE